MEEKIDKLVDMVLNSLSSRLYFGSIILGIALIILGIIFLLEAKMRKNKAKSNIGLACIGIGILGIISGFVQLF
jgi:hypothetical protein